MNLTAVVFSWGTWGRGWNLPEMFAAALYRSGVKVIYVEKPHFRLGSSSTLPYLDQQEEGFWILRNPFRFPNKLLALPGFKFMYYKILSAKVKHALNILRLDDSSYPILLIPSSLLAPTPVLDYFEKSIKIGVAGDWWTSSTVKRAELEMVRRCHIILAISDCVYDRYRQRWPEKVFRVPYGCNYTHICEVLRSNQSVPDQIRCLSHPIIGYLGPIGPRVCQEMIVDLAQRNPMWSFVFIGGIAKGIKGFKCNDLLLSQNNIKVLPPQPLEVLPLLVASFDVGMLPYDLSDEQVFHCTPQKVWEYFAVGIPVVSTPILELLKFKDLIYFGTTTYEFEEGIRQALQERQYSDLSQERRRLAQSVSLENMGKSILDIVKRVTKLL